MVADFVSPSFNMRNHLWVPDSSFANEEEGCLGVVLPKNLEDSEREGWMWAVVKGKRNHRTMSPNSIGYIGRESLDHPQDSERLHPEHQQPHPEKSDGHQEGNDHTAISPPAIRAPMVFRMINFLRYTYSAAPLLRKKAWRTTLKTWPRPDAIVEHLAEHRKCREGVPSWRASQFRIGDSLLVAMFKNICKSRCRVFSPARHLETGAPGNNRATKIRHCICAVPLGEAAGVQFGRLIPHLTQMAD